MNIDEKMRPSDNHCRNGIHPSLIPHPVQQKRQNVSKVRDCVVVQDFCLPDVRS